jgi:hypothetical protein
MFFVWGVPLKSYATLLAVLMNLAVNLPLKQTFVSLTPVMTRSLVVTTDHYHYVSRRDAHFKLSRVVIRFSCAEIRP